MYFNTILAAAVVALTPLASAADYVIDNRCGVTFIAKESINGKFVRTIELKPGAKYREFMEIDDPDVGDTGLKRHFDITDKDTSHQNPTILLGWQTGFPESYMHAYQKGGLNNKRIRLAIGSGDGKCRDESGPDGKVEAGCTTDMNMTFALCFK